MAHKNIFTERVSNGNREYRLNIVEGSNSELHLIISRYTTSSDKTNGKRIRIPVKDIGCIRDALNRIVEQMAGIGRRQEDDTLVSYNPSYTLDDKRKEHAHAYLPWSAEDDEKLEKLFCEGWPTKNLAKVFERNTGAISSRIKKLELREKYNTQS